MCGRYSLSPQESREIMDILRQVQDKFKTGEVFPTDPVPVLMEAGAELAPEVMVWGYPGVGGKGRAIINARSETALERPMFRQSVLGRRCVFPTTGFYEWGHGDGQKRKYRFQLPGPDRALYLAGLWNDYTKGDLARNYGAIATKYYGYQVAVVDLRNPTRSDGYNLLTLINHYMDVCRQEPDNLAARARSEKYAKILSKTIINPEGESFAQNQYFYDAAEGVLTAVILLLAEYLPPEEIDGALRERRHIVSVFKLVQELLAPSMAPGRNEFQLLMDHLPEEHKAKWFSGSALNAAEQSMASVMSTVLARLNTFLDSELEQVLCFDSAMDAESFASRKSAIFLILPEEDTTKNFMAGLMIQTLSRELFSVADEHDGKLPNRVVFFCDELGTMPAFDILPLFSAGRSRRLTLVPIIQSLAQLEKNYGKEGAEIIQDNVQDTIFGGFAPNSKTAEALSKALGNRTVMSGTITRGKSESGQSLQMIQRPLMTPDELKSLPKGHFIVMKTGTHPMRTRLRLFLEWGITFGKPYQVPEKAARKVYYADKKEFLHAVLPEFSVITKSPQQKGYHTKKGQTKP